MAISKPWLRINGQLQSLHNFHKIWVKLHLQLENALKLNFEAFQVTENLNPLQGSTLTATPLSKNYVWIYHGMH